MNNKTRIGIVGYGNLGRGVETALKYNDDLELVGIFTRRNPDTLDTKNKAYSTNELEDMKDNIDVLILCGGSKNDIPQYREFYSAHFSTVDCYDNHQDLLNHYKILDKISKENKKVSIIGTGWDPGIFSVQKLYGESILPNGQSYTFWGRGLSQGHSDAVRQIEGVKFAAQYTLPNDTLIRKIENGKDVQYTKEIAHKREVFVVSEDGADEARIEEEIKTMPDYFKDYDTKVHFINEQEYKRDHTQLKHGGYVLRRGYTNDNQATYKLNLNLESNPEFTASVAVATARAAGRFLKEENYGAKSMFDIPPSYLSNKTTETMIDELL